MNSRTQYSALVKLRHPVKPGPDMRGSDKRRRQDRRGSRVLRSVQIVKHSIEPYRDSRRFNASPNLSDNCGAGDLLAENNGRPTCEYEFSKSGPKVALVGCAFSCTGATERLARARAGPDSGLFCKSSPLQSEGPESNSAEHVYLVISCKFVWSDFKDAPFVYVTRWQVAGGDQFPQPSARLRVVVVVVVHIRPFFSSAGTRPQANLPIIPRPLQPRHWSDSAPWHHGQTAWGAVAFSAS